MTRVLVFVALLIGALAAASAQVPGIGVGAPVTINQYAINDNVLFSQGTQQNGNSTTAGKTSVSSTISTSTLVVFGYGQSIGQNSLPTPHTPTNTTTVQNFNIYTGTVYQALDPLLSPPGVGGNYNTYLGDKLITDAKFARFIVIPVMMGGSAISDWIPSGVYSQRIRVACLYVRSLGWLTNPNVKLATIWDQGQQDATVGTSSAVWQSRYAQVKALHESYGCVNKWFVPTDTMVANVVNATIQGAQAAVVDNVSTFAGANTDSLTGANRQGDGTHLSDAGGSANANLWATIIEAHYHHPDIEMTAANDNGVEVWRLAM